MWWIFPVGFLVLCIIFVVLESLYGWEEKGSMISVAMIVVSLVFALIASLYTVEDTPTDTGELRIKNLYAFQDNEVTSIKGGGNIFFWGFSSKQGLKYRYITDGNIGKVVVEEDIGNFEIIDNENTNPRIEYHTFAYERTSPFWAWMFGESGDEFEIKVAYIPEGSLIQDYIVNLE